MSEQEQVVKLDLSGLKEAMTETVKQAVQSVAEQMMPKPPVAGKGVVSGSNKDMSKVLENLKKCRESDIKEQWSLTIPNYTLYEISANLRDYVWITEEISGKQGDTVNIPYVKDHDFQTLTNVGDAFSGETTGLIAVLTTVLKEAGSWSDIAYADIEKIDRNLLDELNSRYVVAARRAEDSNLLAALIAFTGTNFAGTVTDTGSTGFSILSIPKAIALLLAAQKNVAPQNAGLILYMTPKGYGALLKTFTSNSTIMYGLGAPLTNTMIEKWLGVTILIGGRVDSKKRTSSGTTGTCEVQWLMRPKRCLALAPKRDLLVETDKQIATRKLRITASHTFGVKVLDAKEAVRVLLLTTAIS